MKNIYNYLKADHKKVSTLFDEISKTDNDKKTDELFLQIKQELILHSEAENETFYKALKKNAEMKSLIIHSEKEHMGIKDYLDKLSGMKKKEQEWFILLGELKAMVEHHVHEEEKEIFLQAKKIIDKDLEYQLAEQIEEFKEKWLKKHK